jgi:hypothetical protein
MSRLVDGWIPAHTACPFREHCNFAKPNDMGETVCFHKGVEHTTAFSCATARLFDMVES